MKVHFIWCPHTPPRAPAQGRGAGQRAGPGRYPFSVPRSLVALCLSFALVACGRPESEPSGVSVDPRLTPLQEPIEPSDVQLAARASFDAAAFEPTARYRIAARVLSRERYYLGWQSELSPLDLALGWGALSDPAVDEHIDWYQGGRWYFWRWSEKSPYQSHEISAQSANVHVIPASENLRRALLNVRENDVIQLRGLLVNIVGPEGQSWRSSLSRTDTGGRSCEVLYATELVRRERVYR